MLRHHLDEVQRALDDSDHVPAGLEEFAVELKALLQTGVALATGGFGPGRRLLSVGGPSAPP